MRRHIRLRCFVLITTVVVSLRLVHICSALASEITTVTKVAVIGTTGRLGRETIKQLSQQGIATRCLLRHTPISTTTTTTQESSHHSSSKSTSENKDEIIRHLKSLPGVELINGDINDRQSLATLIEGTTACLALHGPTVPKPFFRSLIPLWFPENDVQHPKQVNYIGIQNLLSALTESTTCKHLIRITGKGETPWSIFSILINVFGGIAKGWNYEGEQLIRSQDEIKYTIIRPGIMKESISDTTNDGKSSSSDTSNIVLGLRDNGNDMKVSVVAYSQIAQLAIQALSRSNCQRTTITAMNVDTTITPKTQYQTIDEVQTDTREFPASLIDEHKKAARFGGITIMIFGFFIVNAIITVALKAITFVANTISRG